METLAEGSEGFYEYTGFFPPQPSLSTSQTTKQGGLRFRALLTDGASDLEVALV